MEQEKIGLVLVWMPVPMTAGAQPCSSQPHTRQVLSAKIFL